MRSRDVPFANIQYFLDMLTLHERPWQSKAQQRPRTPVICNNMTYEVGPRRGMPFSKALGFLLLDLFRVGLQIPKLCMQVKQYSIHGRNPGERWLSPVLQLQSYCTMLYTGGLKLAVAEGWDKWLRNILATINLFLCSIPVLLLPDYNKQLLLLHMLSMCSYGSAEYPQRYTTVTNPCL